MRTTTKKLENAVTQIKVTFDKKEWAEAQDAALKRLATRVKLDGFRPGKAPVAMIKARLGKQAIYDEATDQILQKRYADIMKKAEVAPIAQPTLNIDSVDNDNLKITILCPVKPEVELGEYKGLEVKKGRVTVAKKDIEAQVENYRHQFAELTTKENGEVAKGDTVVMDFEGFIDGEAFEGGKAENHSLEIGSGQFIPGFEDQMIGMTCENEKDVAVTFPEDYQATELAGKEATFKVTVHEIKEKVLPEADDELAKDVNIEGVETLDQLKEEIDSKDNKDNSNEEMKTIVIDGNEYIGYISIPAIDLELPVMSQWSYQGLKIAPGRFYGSTYGHNLVIAGHNYAKHFSSIKWLEKTTEVDFIDVENRVWSYQVSDIETLQPQQVDEMIEKTGNDNWDLTLFTCTTGGQTRCTVRCVLNQND